MLQIQNISQLQKIQEVVQGIAEAISSALMFDVEIMDSNFVAIGATGRIRSHIGIKQSSSHVARHVVRCGLSLTVENPGKHPICTECKLTENCFYTAALLCSINLNGQVLGTISMVSFDDTQREQLLQRQGQYLDFIARMGELLAGQVQLHEAMCKLTENDNYLKTIIDCISEGVIAVDSSSNIVYFNRSAEKILNHRYSLIAGKPVSDYFPDSLLYDVLKHRIAMEDKEVTYHTKHKKTRLLCSGYPIVIGKQIVGAVESLKELSSPKRPASSFVYRQEPATFDDIKGNSLALRSLIEKAMKVAAGNSTVFLSGESGTGKELFAQAIHCASPFSSGPFQAINCSAIPDSLLESELFGYDEGAFTGAKKGGKPGKFELADGGTLFLDEIGDMPISLQSKLLRVLETGKLERIGGTREIAFNVRIITATNRNLENMIEQKQFREDLFYRLNVIPLRVPSLRERQEDILHLAEHFLEKYNILLGKQVAGLEKGIQEKLMSYSWPGNVRELENVIEYAVNFEQSSRITLSSLPRTMLVEKEHPEGDMELKLYVKGQEKQLIENMMAETGTSLKAKKAIAKHLGISLTTLYTKLKG